MGDEYDLRDFGNVARLFPLPGVVLFPHSVLPLHIFEPRYRQMTEDALAGDMLVTMVMLREPVDWSAPGEPPIEPVGCLGRIIRHERLPDGRFNFLLLGLKRVRIVAELDSARLYREAEVEVLDDVTPKGFDPVARAELIELFRTLASRHGALDDDVDRLLRSSVPPGVLADIIAHAVGLPPALKQELLGEPRVARRVESLVGALRAVVGASPDDASSRRSPPPFSMN